MTGTFGYDVFISHSTKDKAAARDLAQRLKADGLRVIQYGELSEPQVEKALEGSRVLVLLMSADAFASEWATLERHTAPFRDPADAQRRFVPLRLDDAEIPEALEQFARVDWRQRSDEQYGKLLAACRLSLAALKSTVVRKGEQLSSKILEGHMDLVWCVAVTPDGRRAVSGSDDGTMRVWDLKSGQMPCHPPRVCLPGVRSGDNGRRSVGRLWL